jgi:LasA protease
MKSAFYKAAVLLVVMGMFLSACGSDLWGTYDPYMTTTPGGTATRTVFAGTDPTFTATSTPTATIIPSSTADLPTAIFTPNVTSTLNATINAPAHTISYISQSGDSVNVVAEHFGVQPSEIISGAPLPASGFINPGTPLFLPDRLTDTPTTPATPIIPDSELVDSPTAVGFDIQDYVKTAGGKLSTLRDYMNTEGWLTGADGVTRISLGSSISPRLILALIQYYTGYVQGTPKAGVNEKYPLDYNNPNYPGLYQQLRLTIMDLLPGYYGWRAGNLTELTFPDGTKLRIAPNLNAGTVALQYYFSRRLNYADWKQAVDPQTGFIATYRSMFGDPWTRADELGPLFPPDLAQPTFSLPFEVAALWSMTSGPHPAWEAETALAALDFAPAMAAPGCGVSNAWVLAMSGGKIVRSGDGYVMLDLDGDGFEQTGWVVLYMHIADNGRVPLGTWVNVGDRIGHPSCKGGEATGTHVHIARKYNGEWVAAGDPLPFVMSGWTVHAGGQQRQGTMTKGDQIISASPVGSHESHIVRKPDE